MGFLLHLKFLVQPETITGKSGDPVGYYRYAGITNPDVWFETSEVWKVKAADLTISPVYRAAMDVLDLNKEKGDLDIVAKASHSSQSMMRKLDALTIRKVFKTFRNIAIVILISTSHPPISSI
ncbi:hypothetical protein TanjilG_27891 [Lupinus angustifolius]|uniref:DNA ligase ATP-dependent N-terminal domain-containing protein n=1 Tax=Lupinus angustifolius TaxID=3871 RepID=A0A394DGW9_LUPAN|nr:hypothetical protein TanjilG_27891 [Lupinus angustifolius]